MADLVELPPEAASLTPVVVAKDSIAIVVHPDNEVSDLSTAQLQSLFNGQTTNWKEVGGEDRPITVVSREAGSGTRSSFEKILGGIQLTPNAIIQNSNGTVRETVAADGNAVGYLSHGLLNEKIKALRVDGHECTTEEIIKGGYTLVRPVFLLTQGEPQGEMKAFIDFILSPHGQQIIRDSGLIPAK
jgi:phosphate transport system substrate-binding protein